MTGGASADEGESLVSSSTGRVSGEGSISMSEEISSFLATKRMLSEAGTSSALPVPSGDASSFDETGSEASRAPGEAASLNRETGSQGEVPILGQAGDACYKEPDTRALMLMHRHVWMLEEACRVQGGEKVHFVVWHAGFVGFDNRQLTSASVRRPPPGSAQIPPLHPRQSSRIQARSQEARRCRPARESR